MIGHGLAALLAAVGIGLVQPAATGAGADRPDPYSAVVGVTGRDNRPERERGIGEAFTEVMVKVTGDRTILAHPRFGQVRAAAEDAVRDLRYRDRKEGVQVSDEQGTRDRSFELTVVFEPIAIDNVARALDAEPWTGERPTVRVLLGVTDSMRSYVLASDTEPGYGQREIFRTLSQRRGIDLAIPTASELGEAGLDNEAVATLVETARQPARDVAGPFLTGVMVMDATGFWTTRWRLVDRDTVLDWQDPPTTFDRGIADAVDRTIRHLARLD
ncbi:DUF2066 domain-containing protein [Marinivivus vitaminiproducens]|uniref:DUF2066 domain-containing protein n=1 Tax=Marinivivus vitaminiproducens TaxID=3035935 RepID=UPI002798C04E|nr:DUF2066 domain-containing protein [Geminicoccaceae bacterium SCSIO 64248]